jgi:hypothetical protein
VVVKAVPDKEHTDEAVEDFLRSRSCPFFNLPAKRPLLDIGSPDHVAVYAVTAEEIASGQVPRVEPEVLTTINYIHS